MNIIKNIRNFCIIAHIDHGKSTLSKKIIEYCSILPVKTNILDNMDLEKEKGITIKSHNITLYYTFNNIKYQFNLIDTPGHADFSNEVIHSLIACEGALLLIDITKGIQAQTIANYNIAKNMGVKIIPVLNKIDLLKIKYNQLKLDLNNILGLNFNNKYILCSAKKGIGIKYLIKNIINLIPFPKGKINESLEAIILDTWFDSYEGIICLICIKHGSINKFDNIKIFEINKIYKVKKIGLFIPNRIEVKTLISGEIGWLIYSKKDFNINPVGYSIININNINYHKKSYYTINNPPLIYNSIYPINNKDFNLLKNAIKKLNLNDASFTYELISSNLLGYGYKCGFLGLLHMEIITQRLQREYKLQLLITLPSINYKIQYKKNNIFKIININNTLCNINNIKNIYEPIVECIIVIPIIYIGKIIILCNEKRGIQLSIEYFNNKNNVILKYEIPLNEIIINFINQLQIITHGYGTFKYSFKLYRKSNISILEILLNKKNIYNLKFFIHETKILKFSKNLLDIFKNNIPKHLFEILIQIKVNNKIISSTIIKPLRKNVLSKCYGGDITRKKKLLQKQKIGKLKMKKFGNINIPKDIFFKINNIKN